MQDIIAWLVVLWALSLVGFPFASGVCGLRRLADRGWAVSRTLSLLAVAWITWIGGGAGVIPNSTAGVGAVLIVLGAVSAWLAYRQRVELADFFRRRWAVVATVELTFLAMFAFWALVISEVPGINHTEKPMDFGILNAIASADGFPPEDQWLSGHSIAYYYGGHYMAATLATLSGVATDKAYNLAVATVPAMLSAGLLGLVYNLLRFSGARVFPSLAVGALTALAVVMLGNLSGILELAYVRGVGGDWFWQWVGVKGLEPPAGGDGWLPDGFWWWWRGTRVIDTLGEGGVSLDYTITEVPFFSFLLGDLHAHVTSLPFTVLALSLALAMLVGPHPPGMDWLRRRPGEAATLALALGALAFINAWDFPLYLAITALAAAAGWLSLRQRAAPTSDLDAPGSDAPGSDAPGSDVRGFGTQTTAVVSAYGALAGSVARAMLLAVGLAAAGVLLYLPFYLSFDSQAGGILPITGPATRHFLFLVVMGVPAMLATGLIARSAMGIGWPSPEMRKLVWPVLAVSVAPFFIWLVGVGVLASLSSDETSLADGLVWRRVTLAVVLLLVGGLATYCALVLAAGRRPMQWLVFALIMAAAGFYLLAGAELFRISDLFGNRMNTVFKSYYQAWLLLGIAGGVGFYHIVAAPIRRRWADYRAGLLRAVGIAWAAFVAALVLASAYYPVAAALERTGWFQDGETWADNTLSGLEYLRQAQPSEYDAIAWLKDQPGPGRIVEAVGNGYSDYGRISASTGRATVLGWEGHQHQWRGDDQKPLLEGRRHDVLTIYTSENDAEVLRLLQRYGVRWLVVGPRERQTYGEGLNALIDPRVAEGWLTPAFVSDDLTIYEVRN